jgi:hypothetical protein
MQKRKPATGTNARFGYDVEGLVTLILPEKSGKLWYSMSLCEDARPSAPTMSFGSRANQVKPEALVILFRANP